MTPSVKATLRSVDGLDDFDERTVLLGPNVSVSVGRSSKNAAKRLMASPNNAFIDSPVVSREHAVFTADTTSGVPIVYITDLKSMHGTMVNEVLVTPEKKHRLMNGDTLQLGQNVVRDQGRPPFIAKKYEFSARLASPPLDNTFPHGFSVPDEVSSDDEDDEEEVLLIGSSPNPPNYGTQTNPVNVDDFEDVPDVEIEDDEDDLAPQSQSVEPADRTSPEKEDEAPSSPVYFSEDAPNSPDVSVSARQFSLAQDDNSSDEEEGHVDALEDDAHSAPSSEAAMDSRDEDSLSEDGSVDNSEGHSSFESEDSEDDTNKEANAVRADAVRRLKIESMLRAQQDADSDGSITTPALPSGTPMTMQSPPTMQAAPAPESRKFHVSPFATRLQSRESEPEKFKAPDVEPMDFFSDGYGNNHWDNVCSPAVPSRPSAPKPMSFSSMDYSTNGWYGAPSVNMFSMQAQGYRNENLTSFMRAPPTNNHANPFLSHSHMSFSDTRPAAPAQSDDSFNGGTTVPMGVSTTSIPLTSDDTISTTPQPNLRTKVSIAEIVEEAPQQPPTPTSISSPPSLKRKADALEAEQEKITKDVVADGAIPDAAPVVSAASAVPERPKKRIRRALRFASTLAAGVAVGGASVVGALAYLPESFFNP